MTKDDLLLDRLKEISERLTGIEGKLDRGQERMSDNEKEILKLQLSKKFANKQMAVLWLFQVLVITAFLNSYYQLQYTKPKSPAAPIKAVVVK